MTYPENARLTDSLRLAGGVATEGSRRYEQDYDATWNAGELAEAYSAGFPLYNTVIQQAKKQAIYWEENLIGSPMKFSEYATSIPDRFTLARYAQHTLPELEQNFDMKTVQDNAFDLDDFLLREGDMPGAVEALENAKDEALIRGCMDAKQLPAYLAVSDMIGEEEQFDSEGKFKPAPLLRRRQPMYWSDSSLPYGGT